MTMLGPNAKIQSAKLYFYNSYYEKTECHGAKFMKVNYFSPGTYRAKQFKICYKKRRHIVFLNCCCLKFITIHSSIITIKYLPHLYFVKVVMILYSMHVNTGTELKHSSSDGSAFASQTKGRGFKFRWILWDALLSERRIVTINTPIVITRHGELCIRWSILDTATYQWSVPAQELHSRAAQSVQP